MEKREQQPQESIVERHKREAAEIVANKIENLQKQENISQLDAARRIYEEVKGHEYREEQALAKLLEYLEMTNEVDMRKEEIKDVYPIFGSMFDREKPIKKDYSLEKAA